jgi:type IV pilus assembly protein PilB
MPPVSPQPAQESEFDQDSHHNAPTRSVGDQKVPYDVLKYIPQESARHYKIAPLSVAEGVLEVGMVDPENIEAIDALNFISRQSGMPFKVFRLVPVDLEKVLQMYKGLGGEVDKALTDLADERSHDEASLTKKEKAAAARFASTNESQVLDLDDPDIAKTKKDEDGNVTPDIHEDAPAIKLVSTILRYAIDGKASDVHIEPSNSGVRVRYRVDGALHTSVVLPSNTHRAIVARIKVLASIRLDESRKPQDGRFSASIDNRAIDFRVSTFPAYFGEKIVIRILDREQGYIPLGDIGLTPRDLAALRAAVKRPYGLILISGPTGSGKSTTLYSMLAEVDREKLNVLSLEDPVEYFMDGVNQSQVRPEIGYTFASGLRTTLRQDPNVIMVGEIRDAETAKLAIQAALTGHLVLSTIHTNSAVGTIPRLIDMGVEPYLIAPVLVLSIAQRLVLKLCPDSGTPVPLTASMRDMMVKQMSTLPEASRLTIQDTVYEPERTATCPTGTRGRLAVFEVLEMTPEVENVILKQPVESKIWAAARKQGMMTMYEDAMIKAFEKKIPFSEVSMLSNLVLADDEPELPKAAETPEIPPTV